MPVESPCLRICQLDEPGRFCIGCWRTTDEIAQWSRMTEDEQRQVLEALEKRRNIQQQERPPNE